MQNSRLMNTPEKKVIASTTDSLRLECRISPMCFTSTSPQATMNSTPAMAACGRYAASGATANRMASRNSAEEAAAIGERAPAS